MKKTLKVVILNRKELISILDNVEVSINKDVVPTLKDMITMSEGKSKLVDNVLYGRLNLKDDSMLFTRLLTVVNAYNGIIGNLKDKINSELSDTITGNSGNINNNLALSLLSTGVFLSKELVEMLGFIVATNYSDTKTDLDKKVISKNIKNIVNLSKLLPELEKVNYDKIVDAIGNVPVLKTLRYEETSDIPVEVALDFFKTTFKIKDNPTVKLIKDFLTGERNTDVELKTSFIGNPIYHIRLFLIDLEELRLDYYRNEVKLLELRLLELKSSEENKPELKKAIIFYENKINKLNSKINKLIELD